MNALMNPANVETRAKIMVTPTLAQEWLQKSIGNRPISSQTVGRYAETMALGRWRAIKSEPVVFSSTGKLMNAHHRLKAVIRANQPVEFWVEFAEDEENMLYLDDGRSRRPVDNKFILTQDPNCVFRDRIAKVLLNYFGTAKSSSFSISALEEAEDGIREAFDHLTQIDKIKAKIPAPYLAALSYFYPVSPRITMEFCRSLVTREGGKGTPVGAVLSLMSNSRNTGIPSLRMGAFSATTGALERALKDQPLEVAKPNTGAVARVTLLRSSIGIWVPSSRK